MASLPLQTSVESAPDPESLNIKHLSLDPSTATNNHESNTPAPTSTPSTTTTLDSDPAPPSQSQTTDPTSSNSNQNPPLVPDGDKPSEAEDPNHNEEDPAEKVKKPDWWIKRRAARKRNSVLRPGYNKKYPKDSAYAAVRAKASGGGQGEREPKPEVSQADGTDDASKQEE